MLSFTRQSSTLAALAIASCSSISLAGISTYASDISQITDITNHANFNSLVNDQSLANYQEDGLVLDTSRNYFSWNAPGLDGSEMYYASTGTLEQVSISLEEGMDFTDMEMQLSSGFSPQSIGTMYLWIQLFDNGQLVGDINLDATTGQYIGLVGGGFDNILIGAYQSAQDRDANDPNARNAVAIDNISVGTAIPAPGTLALSGIALMGLRRRR